MGHDITAHTRSGETISGPYFSRYWCPHYEYFEASHHNAGISGDGKSDDVTVDQLRQVLKKVNADLFRAQDKLKHYEGFAEMEYEDVQDTKAYCDFQLLETLAETLDQFSEFIKTCIAEDVVRVTFH